MKLIQKFWLDTYKTKTLFLTTLLSAFKCRDSPANCEGVTQVAAVVGVHCLTNSHSNWHWKHIIGNSLLHLGTKISKFRNRLKFLYYLAVDSGGFALRLQLLAGQGCRKGWNWPVGRKMPGSALAISLYSAHRIAMYKKNHKFVFYFIDAHIFKHTWAEYQFWQKSPTNKRKYQLPRVLFLLKNSYVYSMYVKAFAHQLLANELAETPTSRYVENLPQNTHENTLERQQQMMVIIWHYSCVCVIALHPSRNQKPL